MEKSATTHEGRSWRSFVFWLGLLVMVFGTGGLVTVSLLQGWIWLSVPLVFLMAHWMHGHLVAFHEAAHSLLAPRRGLNDFLGFLIGLFSFMSLSLYRATHRWHHAYLASERDEELWPFVDATVPLWKRRLAAFLELNFGLFYTPFLFLRSFFRPGSLVRNPRIRRRIWAELALMALFWSAIVAGVAWWNVWSFFVALYLIPAFLAGNMQSWRKYVEHMGLTGDTPLTATRTIFPRGTLGHAVSVSLLHEPYHGIHHVHSQVPHDALPALAPGLEASWPQDAPPFRSYWQAGWRW